MSRRLCMLLAAVAATATLPAAAGPVRDRIYPAPKAPLSLDGLPEGAALTHVRTADGLGLAGIIVPARAGMPTLLVLHGNGSSAADAVRWLAPVAAAGYGLVAAEYRGYSGNPGVPGEAGLTQDAEAFLAAARTQAGASPVWVIGHSLGGGVAIALARREKLDALVTIGAFTRLRAAAPKLARALVPNEYDNLGAVRQLDEPWFLIHGTADDVVPSSEGRALHVAAGAAHRIGASFVIAHGGHRPEAAQLLAILTTIRGWFGTGRWSAAALPPEIAAAPFGSDEAIQP